MRARRGRSLFGARTTDRGVHPAALTPLVDLLVLLLVFLLRTWTAEASPPLSERDMSLPVTREEVPPARGIIVDVGRNGLFVDGWRAGSVAHWTRSEDVLVSDIFEALQARGGQRVLVRADRDAPWSLLSKVLFTVQQAGYSQVELVAVSQASL